MNQQNNSLLVMKFGGSALANYKNIHKISKIISKYSETNDVIVVVSAVEGVTDKLYKIVELIKKGQVNRALQEIEIIYNLHIHILSKLDKAVETFDTQQKIKTLIDLLRMFVKKVFNTKITNSQIDYIVSFGERLSIHLVVYILKKENNKALAVDTSYLLTTNKEFGNAKPVIPKTRSNIKELLGKCLKEKVIPVITGYIGHAEDGCITTLGRGGSDYSASLMASFLKANGLILWKDVKGLYDKDPKRYPDAHLMKETDYDTAIKLSKNDAKILHPESVITAKKANISVYIKCFLMPNLTGTRIWKKN